MEMLAVAATGAPPASRDPLASVSAPAMRRYRRDRGSKAVSSVVSEASGGSGEGFTADVTAVAVRDLCDIGAPARRMARRVNLEANPQVTPLTHAIVT